MPRGEPERPLYPPNRTSEAACPLNIFFSLSPVSTLKMSTPGCRIVPRKAVHLISGKIEKPGKALAGILFLSQVGMAHGHFQESVHRRIEQFRQRIYCHLVASSLKVCLS